MRLIVNKNVFQSKKSFFEEIKNTGNALEGVSLEVVLTKDGIPIVMTPYEADNLNTQLINYIQKTNLEDISSYEVLTLEEALNNLQTLSKKILINFIPVSTTPYAQNIELINKVNQEQVNNLYKVLDLYPTLNLYVSSISHNIIFHIRNKEADHKIGVILSAYETNYIDVDFYIFAPDMLSLPIIKQQLDFKKEVIIASRSCEDMMTIYKFFRTCPKIDGEKVFNNVTFISNYPLILYKLFK